MDSSLPGSSVHGFPRQEYWSKLPFPSPRDLPDPGIEPMSPALAGGFYTTEPPENPHIPLKGRYQDITQTNQPTYKLGELSQTVL